MSEQIYCQIRKTFVAALPEEQIRQRLIFHMVQNLGFPLNSLVLEKGLRQMPHLALCGIKIPSRRADLLCFAKDIHPEHSLYPLLLVECKAVKLNRKVINQIAGYNHFLKAYFICVVNEKEIRTGWYDANLQSYTFVNQLPSYAELIKNVQKPWSPPTTPEGLSAK